MKTLLLAALLAWSSGGDRERGLQLYREGKFAEAAAAFRAAIEHDGDSAELQWNLALASWRAGELAAAETAAEKYAALDRSARVELHAGLLGAVRHDEAMALAAQGETLLQAPPPAPSPAPPGAGAPAQPADPLPVFEQALTKATQARDHFVRGAAAQPTPELLRNTERSLRTIDELQKKIDELKKQREQQQKDDSKQDDEKKEKEQKKDEPKQDEKQGDEKPKPDEKQSDEKQSDEKRAGENSESKPGKGEEKPEPKPDEQSQPKPGEGQEKPGDQPKESAAEPKPGEKRQDAPGEQQAGKELTPEQQQRLAELLKELDGKMKQIRVRAKAGRKPVERDW